MGYSSTLLRVTARGDGSEQLVVLHEQRREEFVRGYEAVDHR